MRTTLRTFGFAQALFLLVWCVSRGEDGRAFARTNMFVLALLTGFLFTLLSMRSNVNNLRAAVALMMVSFTAADMILLSWVGIVYHYLVATKTMDPFLGSITIALMLGTGLLIQFGLLNLVCAALPDRWKTPLWGSPHSLEEVDQGKV